MPTYDPLLGLTEMTPGDPNVKNSWGTVLDQQFTLLGQAITGDNGYGGGVGGINIAGLSTYALTATAGASNQARQLIYPFVGALSAACTVTIPATVKVGWVINATTGGQNVILTAGGGTQLTLPANKFWYFFYSDGTGNVISPSLALQGGLITGATLNPTSLTTGALTVTGAATVDGQLTVDGALAVNAAASFGSNVGVAGTVVAAGLNVSGATSVASLTASGNLVVAGTSTFDGAVTAASTLNVSGAANFTATSGNTIWNLTCNTSGASPAITVNGNASLASLTTTGVVTLGAGLSVQGSALFASGSTLSTVYPGFQLTSSGSTATGAFTTPIAISSGSLPILCGGVYFPSDARIKPVRNKISAADGVRFVREVPGVLYQKETPAGRNWEAGFVAQDVLAAGFHELVMGFEDPDMPASRYGGDGKEGVRYEMILGGQVGYLQAALKEALERIDALTALLDTLEAD
jgi:cytoskeletal protein CcmA (bactofilin family)